MKRAPTDRMIAPGSLAERTVSPPPTAAMADGYAISASAFEQWLGAPDGPPRIIYAQGYRMPAGHVVVRLAAEAEAARLVSLIARVAVEVAGHRADQRWWHFIAERRGGGVARQDSSAADEPMEAVWRHIKRAAMGGQPGPTNDELARHCGLKDADAARYQLAKLVSAGRVAVDSFGPRQRRIFTILSGEARGAATLAIKDRGAVIGGGAI